MRETSVSPVRNFAGLALALGPWCGGGQEGGMPTRLPTAMRGWGAPPQPLVAQANSSSTAKLPGRTDHS